MTFVHVSSGASAGGLSFSISFIPLLLYIAMQQKKAPRPHSYLQEKAIGIINMDRETKNICYFTFYVWDPSVAIVGFITFPFDSLGWWKIWAHKLWYTLLQNSLKLILTNIRSFSWLSYWFSHPQCALLLSRLLVSYQSYYWSLNGVNCMFLYIFSTEMTCTSQESWGVRKCSCSFLNSMRLLLLQENVWSYCSSD